MLCVVISRGVRRWVTCYILISSDTGDGAETETETETETEKRLNNITAHAQTRGHSRRRECIDN